MKLYRGLLLLFFLGILFVSVVGDISARVDHDGPYTAEALAYRFGGGDNTIHVYLYARASSTPFGRNGAYHIVLRRQEPGTGFLGVPIEGKDRTQKDNDDVILNIWGLVDGFFYDSVTDLRQFEEHGCIAEADATGESSAGRPHHAAEFDIVPPMPPRSNPEFPNPDGVCDSPGIYPVNSLYTATAGETKESCLVTSEPYSSVEWYIQSPSEIVDGVSTYIETDSGDGATTEARMNYQFPAGASGDYVIYVNVELASDNSTYNESYTVSVTPASE